MGAENVSIEKWAFVRAGCRVVRDKWPKTICKLGIGGMSSDEIMERGHLIAAAPEMLEALRAVISVADRKTKEFDAARAAIAKAEGRS